MIIYSRQNPIDMCSTVWSFNDTLNRFYNWLNQPVQSIVNIPARKVKLQLYEDDTDFEIETAIRVINSQTGDQITGIAYAIEVPSDLSGTLFEYSVDLSLINTGVVFYVQIDVIHVDERTETIQSSCLKLTTNTDCKLIRIEFANTVNDRLINGILFDTDSTFNYYLYANKFDTDIEILEDDTLQDFKGNTILVDKTHSEIDIFELIDIPKKYFMSLITISENDEIWVNGRRANITFDKATESRIGIYEIPYINALMRVTYADDNGLLQVQNQIEPSFLRINSDGYLRIDIENTLKIN